MGLTNGIGIGTSFSIHIGTEYLLAAYPGAEVAYSVRQLSPTSTLCMRIRRSSDNAETDIGFVGGTIDTATINTFKGASTDVYVTKWYDQSGNDNHLIQATLIEQPRIVASSAIITVYDIPAIAVGAAENFDLTSSVDTNNDFSAFNVNQRTGTVSVALYGSASGVPFSMIKFSDNKYYTWGESGYIVSDAVDATADEPVYYSCIFNNSVKTQYRNGVSIASSYTASAFNEPLTGSNAGAGYWQEYVLYLSDQSANRAGIEANQNFFFDIVQSGYIFDVEELTADAGITGLEDSTNFFRISDTEVGLVGGFGNFPATNNVTDKFFTSNDFITWTDEANPIPVGPCSHVISGLREDGLIWFFGRSQNLPGPVIKFFVCTLNPATKVWNTIDADVVGNESFLQWGFFHNDYMYGAFDDGSDYVLRRSSDGLTWTDMCVLPAFAVDSSAWSDGTRIRFAGGGVDIGAPATDVITAVYESLDDGASFSVVSTLPVDMRDVWPNYGLYEGYEIKMNGAWGPTNDDWGKLYFRPLGNGSWTLASTQNRRFADYFLYPGHAGATLIWNGDLYFGFMANHGTYKISLA